MVPGTPPTDTPSDSRAPTSRLATRLLSAADELARVFGDSSDGLGSDAPAGLWSWLARAQQQTEGATV